MSNTKALNNNTLNNRLSTLQNTLYNALYRTVRTVTGTVVFILTIPILIVVGVLLYLFTDENEW